MGQCDMDRRPSHSQVFSPRVRRVGHPVLLLMIPLAALATPSRLGPWQGQKAGGEDTAAAADPPIRLHPENPHYFLFREKPTVLITSTEHYGAVLNLDFDYMRYLDELHTEGFNLTRLFSGVYVEQFGWFNIVENTLSPAPNRFLCPWARSSTPGHAGGGNKFDLHTWDAAYFRRLEDFVSQAGLRGIVVEMVLFCPYYTDQQWNLSPLKAANNVQGIGNIARTDALTLKSGELLEIEDALVRKISSELNGFDNVYYEVCNEPYFGGVTIEWQYHMISTLLGAEALLPFQHLIAQNISNGSQKVEEPNPHVSIFNFHYSRPPDSVAMNYGLGRVVSDDETGFRGTGEVAYRREGWDFVMAGGGIYDNLDYSFTAGHEDGTFAFPATQPGGGGPSLRSQLKILKDFIESFDFIRLHPGNSVVHALNRDATIYALVQQGEQYAVYIDGGVQSTVMLDLPAAQYRVEWLDPRVGKIDNARDIRHGGGSLVLASPRYDEDIALRLVRKHN